MSFTYIQPEPSIAALLSRQLGRSAGEGIQKSLESFQRGKAFEKAGLPRAYANLDPSIVGQLIKAHQKQSLIQQFLQDQQQDQTREEIPEQMVSAEPKRIEPLTAKTPSKEVEFTPQQRVQASLIDPTLGKVLQKEEEIKLQKGQLAEKAFERSYELQKDFIDRTTSQHRAFETETKPKLLQMQSMKEEDLIGPTAAKFLETIGIPLGALENPSSELYQKLSQDLLKGIPETYGNKIFKVEVENFLKTIPTLMNSADGRRMIASNMLKLGEMKNVFYDEMRRQQMNYIDKGQKFPLDFEQRVFDNVRPQIDRINQQFVKMASIQSVPPNTVPYFNNQGEISFVPNTPDWIDWANKNGGSRIW